MKKIGLALSGGGFRASLFHLGLIRFLRDAGLLSQVTHITSVSGGSILAAHLVLNWERYNGSPGEFDAAAAELIAFVRLDIRNRIVRRFPLLLPWRSLRRVFGRSNRKLGRTGLLEYHYEKHLYGATSLFELPEKPQLHILATNLSEGCLCSFNRNGLLMVHPQRGSACRLDRIHTGLATVAMAVTASSAYPGFFPPLELTGTDVGASLGEFGRQAYTDGGVYDNLGVRMFRCLERQLLTELPLTNDDFVDFPAVVDVLRQAAKSEGETPIHRLGHLLATNGRPERATAAVASAANNASTALLESTNGDGGEVIRSGLWDLLCNHPLHREPAFARLQSLDSDAESVLQATLRGRRVLESGDLLWMNRHLLEAAYRQATGRACLRSLDGGLDCVLVSDVGKPFEVKSDPHAGGMVATAMRATDIVMDRVWQLEIDAFHGARGFVFAPVTDVVGPADDPTAVHPEVQHQVAHVRTDLDRFSTLEISTLVRHGYCVARKACRTRPDVFGTELPAGGPWEPFPRAREGTPLALAAASLSPLALLGRSARAEPAPATSEARTLQASAVRRIWSTLIDCRDWVSYLYVPILVPILVLLPYVALRFYERSHRINQIVESLSQSTRDLQQMSSLIDGPVAPWMGETPEEIRTTDEPDLTGFEVLQDMHIHDLRNWNPARAGKSDAASRVYGYRRLKVFKKPDHPLKNDFRVRLPVTSPLTQVRLPPQQLSGRVRRSTVANSAPDQAQCLWEVRFDFEKVPAGDYVDVILEHLSTGDYLRRGDVSTTLSFDVRAETAEMTRWILLPKGRDYRSYRIIRYKTGKPETAEPVKIVTEYLADDYTILAYKLLSVDAGYTHEVTWYYK
jgi:predicted acylesterase/phospholipase RssA